MRTEKAAASSRFLTASQCLQTFVSEMKTTEDAKRLEASQVAPEQVNPGEAFQQAPSWEEPVRAARN